MWVAAALVLASACGGGRDVGPDLDLLCGDPDGPWVAYLERTIECAPGEAGSYRRRYGRLPTHAEVVAACRGNLKPYLEDGTIAPPDPARLSACRAYLAATPCDVIDPTEPNPCRDLLEGTVGGGSYCERDEQCKGDTACLGGDADSCGGCKPRTANGNACTLDAECTSGSCAGDACAALGGDAATCTSSSGCTAQLVCAAVEGAGADTCGAAPVWALGTPCTPGDLYQCSTADGLLTCGAGGTCVGKPSTVQTLLEAGDACVAGDACGPLLTCHTGKCRHAPYTGDCPAY